MFTFKDKLSKIISTSPDIIQFAKDRKYEESWIIPVSNSRPTDLEIDQYLTKEKFEIIIVEYIWNSNDDNNRFVLTLFLDKKCRLQDPRVFIDISLNLFYSYPGFINFINSIDQNIIGSEYLLNYPIDSINLGVFNFWLSVGPVELWKKGDVYDQGTVVSAIKSRPDIETTSLNYQGLLFRFNLDGQLNGPYYGIKTPCCQKVGDNWAVDFSKIDYWIKLMLGI